MLKKLLHYDLLYIYKYVGIFYILALIFSIISRIFISIDNSTIFNILGSFCGGLAVGMIISSLINAIIRSWQRFIKNIYKDEAYLTHTLPVSKRIIYASKVISSIICAFTTVLISIICLIICYYSKSTIETIKTLLELASNTLNVNVINLLLTIFFIFFLEIIFVILIGYVGIIIGHKYNQNKLTKSIIVSFVLYMLTQTITLIIIFITAIFNKDIMNLFKTVEVINFNIIKKIIILFIILYIVYNVIYYLIGEKLLNKGVNLD